MADSRGAINGTPDVPFLDPVVAEARKRFDRCSEWEGTTRQRFMDDLKFAHGDSDNGYQWPNAIRQVRDTDGRPCLTINVLRQHNLQIVNDLRQNKSGMAVKPAGNGATKESSDVIKAILRRIEYKSNAQAAYTTGADFAVAGGIGWWRLATDYADANSFNQEIFVKRVDDPLSIYMDPDCQEKDCSDGKFAFVFDDVPLEEYEEAYPEFANLASLSPMGIGSGNDSWLTRDHVRIAEYFRKVMKKDKLLSFIVARTGERKNIRASLLPAEAVGELLDDRLTRFRDIYDEVVEWKLISGEKVIDETVWPGKYIPLIRCLGEETKIEGILDRKGHTRAMKDSQRMYNYNASSQVEFVALQGKTPWIAPAKAIEEMEGYWNTANVVNHSVLPWNHMDDDGQPIPAPFKAQPPQASMAYESGMTTAFNQMMMASGQWQNQMGMGGNERTGEAISRRQDQSSTATYHFVDNYVDAIRYTAVQIIDLYPKVYDTQRVLNIQADDGTDLEVEINPAAREAYLQVRDHNGEVVKRVLNPNVGNYEVEADAGPSMGTRREQTVSAMTLLLTQSPALVPIIGDLLLQAMDFKEAQEAAQRLKRMVPPQALGTGPSQNEQMMQVQLASLKDTLGKTLEKLSKSQLKLAGKDQARDIQAYQAETDRIKALGDAMLAGDPQGVLMLIEQLVNESLASTLAPIFNDQGASASLEYLPAAMPKLQA